jgi:hypothetical protein
VSALEVIAVLAMATLEGSLVALPRAGALARLSRLRSPAWALILPGVIVVGTFAPLWRPSLASALVVLAALATPLLALVAVVRVTSARCALLLTPALALALMLGRGPVGELSSSIVTAFGCLSLGVALTRLIPRRWLLGGVALMCFADVVLLAMGVGQSSAGLMSQATARIHISTFDSASVGPVAVDYPDLVLAAVVGGFVAGLPLQRRAAMTLTLLAAASGMLLPAIHIVPETVPIALTFIFLGRSDRSASRRQQRRPAFGRRRQGGASGLASRAAWGLLARAMSLRAPGAGDSRAIPASP